MAAKLALAVADALAIEAIELSEGKPFRRALPDAGRAHVDRALPFLMLNRFAAGDRESLATRVATTSPAYVAWTVRGDGESGALVRAIVERLKERFERVLLVSLYDLPREKTLDDSAPELERFTCRLSVSDDPAAQRAGECLADALAKLEVDLRTCRIEHVSKAWFEPGVETLVDRDDAVSHLSLGLPQNYRIPGEDAIYPQLLHELRIGVFDALLQGFRAFYAAVAPDPPRAHRALGRSAFIAAARSVDRKLYQIATSFDFLLGVSPIDTAQAFARFRGARFAEEPVFHYRPLSVDPDLAKRALYAIDLRRVEDPVLETIFAEKRHELDQQLSMLDRRNSPGFRHASLVLYGAVERPLLEAARNVLDRVAPDMSAGGAADCRQIEHAARALIGDYRAANPDFRASVDVRDDIAGLMVSGHKLMIPSDARVPRARLEALLHHEISVHLLTCVNGAAQGLKIFETGLADYEGIQEGLGVFAECAVGGMTSARLRLLAARVMVVDAMIGGSGFIDCFRLLHDAYGFSAKGAFSIVARIFRSGGFAKDAIYLRGFLEVLELLAQGSDLAPFWSGKIAKRHLPVVDELMMRGLLTAPRSLPAFLFDPQAQARIEALRSLPSLSALIQED